MDYFANVALNFGGQHGHDMPEEDHQYHTSIESINRKHHDAALDFNFQAITETGVSDVTENVNPRKSSGWDSPTELILLKKTAPPILHLWGPYSTTVLLRAFGILSRKWENGHLNSKRETNKPKKIIARLQYSLHLAKCLNIYCVNKLLRTTIVSSIQE